jgi:hypothetical protein
MRSANKITIKDGSLGASAASADNAAAVIGISSINPDDVITISSIEEIEPKLGEGPLRDFLVDAFSFSNPGVCYVKSITGSNEGKISEIKAAKTNSKEGTGKITLDGKPVNAYDVRIEIIENGSLNEGGFQVFVDERLVIKPTTIPAGSAPESIISDEPVKLGIQVLL